MVGTFDLGSWKGHFYLCTWPGRNPPKIHQLNRSRTDGKFHPAATASLGSHRMRCQKNAKPCLAVETALGSRDQSVWVYLLWPYLYPYLGYVLMSLWAPKCLRLQPPSSFNNMSTICSQSFYIDLTTRRVVPSMSTEPAEALSLGGAEGGGWTFPDKNSGFIKRGKWKSTRNGGF